MPVGGKWRIDEIGRSHLMAEARSWGVPEGVARTTIEGTFERLEAGMTSADAAIPDLPDGLRAHVRAHFERLALRTA